MTAVNLNRAGFGFSDIGRRALDQLQTLFGCSSLAGSDVSTPIDVAGRASDPSCPVVCRVPWDGKRRTRRQQNRDEVSEYYHSLLGKLNGRPAGSSRPVRTVGITSCADGEGVTSVATNLALASASTGNHQVLLVDANLLRPSAHHSPSAHHTFRANLSPGFAEAVLNGVPLTTNIQATTVGNLSVLTAGDVECSPGRVYDSAAQLPALYAGLEEQFGLVVFDMPSAGRAGSATGLAALLDGVILVVEAERTRWQVARHTKNSLVQAGANVLGVVLNKRRDRVPNWLYRSL